MKTLALAVCASLCLVVPSFAQTDAGAPPEQGVGAGGPGAGGAPTSGASKGSNKMQELVQGCRKQARSQGLTPQSHEMRQAIMDCVVKERPGMANVMKCRMEGMDKGLKPGDELKSFVKDCMKKNG